MPWARAWRKTDLALGNQLAFLQPIQVHIIHAQVTDHDILVDGVFKYRMRMRFRLTVIAKTASAVLDLGDQPPI